MNLYKFFDKSINNEIYGYIYYVTSLDNYDNVKMAVEILRDKEGLNYGSKKITVSTAGIANKIQEAAKQHNDVLTSINTQKNQALSDYMATTTKTFPGSQQLSDLEAYIAEMKAGGEGG